MRVLLSGEKKIQQETQPHIQLFNITTVLEAPVASGGSFYLFFILVDRISSFGWIMRVPSLWASAQQPIVRWERQHFEAL